MTDFGRAYFGVGFDPAEVAKLQAQADALGARVAQIGSGKASGFGSSLAGAARVARVGLLGMGVAAAYALKQAGSFQQELNILQSVSGATAGQMKLLSAEALRLGADVKLPATSAQDAAQALTELVKGGLSVKDAMAAARPVLQLSAAAQIDNATAAQDAATALNAFHLAGTQATHVADLLAGAANASAGNIQDFAEGLQFAGSAAHGAGQSIADTVTALAEMANAGLSGSVAGSALAQALRSLQAPTAKSRAEMHKLGIDIYDAKGQMLPMPKIIDVFSKATDGLTQKQKNQALATIFGSRAIQAARIVFTGGRDAFDQLAQSVDKTGNAQRLASAQTEGFSGALNQFESQVQTTAIQLGQQLLPAATSVLHGFSGLVGALAQYSGATTAAFEATAAMASEVLVLYKGMQALEATKLLFATPAGPWLALGVAVTGVVVAMSSLSGTTDEATGALQRATDATKGLVSATNDAKRATLDIQQAMLNRKRDAEDVASAQKTLNKLEDAGKKHTQEYRQTQDQLRQSQLNLKRDTLSLGDAFKRHFQAMAQARQKTKPFMDAYKAIEDEGNRLSTVYKDVNGKFEAVRLTGDRMAPRVQDWADKMHDLARRAGDAADKVGGFGSVAGRQLEHVVALANAAQRLAREIRGIPTTHQIAIYEHFYSTTSQGAPTTTKRRLPASPILPATGGLVTGGTPGRDSVPALLTPGEIVMNNQMQKNLLGLLRQPPAALNNLDSLKAGPPVVVKLVAESEALAWLLKFIRVEVEQHDDQLALALRGR